MEFFKTNVDGAFLVKPRKIKDDRGFFARAWCATDFSEAGLNATIRQSNMAVTQKCGTLRGLHYQRTPHAETKFIRCVRGRIFDVVVDLRPESATFRQWDGFELNANNNQALYVPEGCATGYLTLQDDSKIYYHTSADFAPEFATGVRYDDPAFGIKWPLQDIAVISDQDNSWSYL